MRHFVLFFFREQYNGNVTLIKKENIHLNLSTNYENNSAKKSDKVLQNLRERLLSANAPGRRLPPLPPPSIRKVARHAATVLKNIA